VSEAGDEAPAEAALPPGFARFLERIDLLTPHAVRTAVTLGLPRLIHEGTTDVEGLAAATGADAGGLASLLAHLTDQGFLARDGDDHALSQDLGAFLLHPDATFHLDVHSATTAMDRAWAGLHHTIRTGEAGYPLVHGRGFWDHLAADPALGASFDEYMYRASQWTAIAVTSPAWPADGTVVDVGGGDGRLLVALLGQHPGMRGVLVDLPETAARARLRFADEQLGDRTEVVEGSFFDPLPAGGDLYVLGHILHDWPDAEATTILRRVADAAGPDGRVLLVEQVLDPSALTPIQVRSDLLMRVLFGSLERSRDQWEALAAAVGLRVHELHPCDGIRHLIELRPT